MNINSKLERINIMKKTGKVIVWVILVIVLVIFTSDFLVKKVSEDKVFTDIHAVPKNKVGLVLGTSQYLRNGTKNLFFTLRIEAAVTLFKAKKIDYILVSGDNNTKAYNEPRDMLNALLKKGIPLDKIVLDYAGFRTWDSVLRASKVFGQSSFTIVSQKFHNERAIFIGTQKGLDVVGFNARAVSLRYGKKTYLREYLARVKVVLDVLINKSPKFYGDPIKIGS